MRTQLLKESSIIPHFQQYITLTEEEKGSLSKLEQNARRFSVDTQIIHPHNEAERFFTLQSGWACAIRTLANGQRQVLDIFLPGQIIGLREIHFDKNSSDFLALTEIVVCPFSYQQLMNVLALSPRLVDLFFLTLAREQSMLIERIINIGRRNAAERLAHFIVEMKTRLNIDSNRFILPMNQTLIGDALSLSSVHVSRTFKHLKALGLISTHSGVISILDLEGLKQLSGFDGRYLAQRHL